MLTIATLYKCPNGDARADTRNLRIRDIFNFMIVK